MRLELLVPRKGTPAGSAFKMGMGIGLVILIPSNLGYSVGIHRIKEPSPLPEGFWDGPSWGCSVGAGNIQVLWDFRDTWDELWAEQEQREPPAFQPDHPAGRSGKSEKKNPKMR